jgi:anti-sigma regulatory factor (Ser/Thr protein kinase)
VRSACNDWGITGIASEAALVATELVANAVEHAGTACRLRIGLDERGLHLAVRDQRPDRLPRRPPTTPASQLLITQVNAGTAFRLSRPLARDGG